MSAFLESQKPEQAAFKQQSPYFSEQAREDGLYKTKFRPYCLPREHSIENLVPEIRDSVMTYFTRNKIKWHDAIQGNPSNHMCDSMVCCVNFLFQFADKPESLANLLRPLFPTLKKMVPVEDGLFVAHEWIGKKNYLGERITRSGQRTRGANFTSADAAVMFEHTDGRQQMVLIEWKFTESYFHTSLKYSASCTDRTAIYQHLYDAGDCPIIHQDRLNFDAFFFEPFYQLMRQQFLAYEMEKAHECEADVVSLLHISPASNHDFMRITSPGMQRLGISPTDVWKKLVKDPSKFTSIYTENLFGPILTHTNPKLTAWQDYIRERYDWAC